MWVTTTIAATFLALIHPAMALLMSYDLYLLIRGTAVMNKTCNLIVLDKTKQHIYLSKLNFLGYARKPRPVRIALSKVRYTGDYENKFVTMDNYGLFPSIAQYIHRAKTSGVEDSSKNNFRYFHRFIANNEVYLVPRDHDQHTSVCISDDLLHAIMNANQKAVFDYDFTEAEQKSHERQVKHNEDMKEILEFKGVAHVDEE